ncbi:unnamed protein product [Effrenium voratum]|nr:unnamed protein product [Effrenium voratum]
MARQEGRPVVHLFLWLKISCNLQHLACAKAVLPPFTIELRVMMLFRLLMVMLLTVAAKDFLAKKETATESTDAGAGATDVSITEGNLTLRSRVYIH